MFTGLIEDVGTIERVVATDAGRDLRVRCRYDDLAEGESVALNGACLTVRERGPAWFTVAAVETTLGRTTIGAWRAGTRVNLERAMRADSRLGGHIVQGHVDAVARVVSVEPGVDSLLVSVALSPDLARLMVARGSLALDGVSLTVNELPAPDVVQVSLIEYTLRRTTLGGLSAGSLVHVEADVIGKYVQRLVEPYRRESRTGTRESGSAAVDSRVPSRDSR